MAMNYCIRSFICILLLSVVGQAALAAVAYVPFRERVRKADFIFLGVVEDQVALDTSPPPNLTACESPFRYGKESSVRVIRCYKGALSPDENVVVLSDNTFECNTSRLVSGKTYLLMLSQTSEGRYIDVASGQGQWEVAEVGQQLRVMDGQSTLYAGEPLPIFESWIQWAMVDPEPGGPEVITTSGEALTAARESVDMLAIDLSEFGPASVQRKDRKTYPHDIPGFCDPEDPVWVVRWEHPLRRKLRWPPSWTVVECWVHAETGEARVLGRPSAGERLDPEEVMVAVSQAGVASASATPRSLTREEFLEGARLALRDRTGLMWWEKQMPPIPPKASFFEIVSPYVELPEIERTIYLLDGTPRVAFSGNVRKKVSARERLEQWVQGKQSWR